VRHHILYLMGGSGCGKTTLAMNLEKFNPEKYHRVLEITTRPMRDGEKNMWDYEFLPQQEFKKLLENKEIFEAVKYQFAPSQYGARYTELSNNDYTWDVVVASIEGFMAAVNTLGTGSVHHLVNIINDVPPEVKREGRDPKAEENLNLAVISNLNGAMYAYDGTTFFDYTEINLSDLMTYRNDKDMLLEKFDTILKESEDK